MGEARDNPPERTAGATGTPTLSRAPQGDHDEEASDPKPTVGRVAAAVLGTTILVTAASYLAPEPYEATAVGLLFLAATYGLVLRHSAAFVAFHGLSLGGLFEPTRLSLPRMLRESVVALAWALGMFTLVVVPFAIGFRVFFSIHRAFAWHAVLGSAGALSGQLLVIALPEEAFFRGFLQTELEPFFSRRVRLLGADLSLAIVLASAIFALGHLLTNPRPQRLAVFFPSLLFGFLRARTKGIGAGVIFHALCNLLSATLAQGYGIG